MSFAEKTELEAAIAELSEQAVNGTLLEIVEVQVRGAGKARLLRIYIDKPGGTTHGDCELVSDRLGKLLDDTDAMAGDSYTLEVSSPGVERKLSKRRDFERVVGQKIKLSVQQPIGGQMRFEGRLAGLTGEALKVETANGELLTVPLEQVQKANLKFEW